jgi:hypothetical protein
MKNFKSTCKIDRLQVGGSGKFQYLFMVVTNNPRVDIYAIHTGAIVKRIYRSAGIPSGLCVDDYLTLYISYGNLNIISKHPRGILDDWNPTPLRYMPTLSKPLGLTRTPLNNVLICDSLAYRVVCMSPKGRVLEVYNCEFGMPQDVVSGIVDGSPALLLTIIDYYNIYHVCCLRKQRCLKKYHTEQIETKIIHSCATPIAVVLARHKILISDYAAQRIHVFKKLDSTWSRILTTLGFRYAKYRSVPLYYKYPLHMCNSGKSVYVSVDEESGNIPLIQIPLRELSI